MNQWPLHKAHFWERAPFFRLLLPLILGILLYDITDHKQYALASVGLVISFVIFVATAVSKAQAAWVQQARFGSMHIAVACIGWLICYGNDIRNDAHWFGNDRNADAVVARITEAPAEKDKTWKLEVETISDIQQGDVHAASGKAFVYVYKDIDKSFLLRQGDTIMIPATWQAVKTADNPYEFNYTQYCARNNIYYQQFLSADKVMLHNTAAPQLSWIQEAHQWCMVQLATFIKDKKTLGLMQAMLIGDEANLDTDIRQAYSETGIIHIIAISGSHITFFFLVLSFLLGWIKHKKYHWIKYLAAIPLIWVYVLMSGAPPSAVRAALMFTVLGVGFAFDKQANTLNYLLATAFLLLCAQPMWLYAVGFQLSFLAVLSLVLFYKPIYNWLSPTHFITRGLWGAVAASLAAELLTAPLVVYYFHLFPLLFIVANVAAYLFMGVVLILGMLLVAVSSIAPVAGVVSVITTFLVTVFNKLVFGMQQLNPEALRFLDISSIELVLLYIIICGLTIWFMQQRKPAFITALSATCILLVFLCADEYQALSQRKLIAYNINKANHIELIEGKYYHVLSSADSISPKNRNYTLKPAHTGLHSWRLSTHQGPQDILYINGRTILLLNNPLYNVSTFHADDVIVNYKSRPAELDILQRQFTPQRIILSNAVKPYAIPIWDSTCRSQNISLHAVSRDGAFIL